MKEIQNDPLKDPGIKLYVPKDFEFQVPRNSILVESFLQGEPCSFIIDWQFPKLKKRRDDNPAN